MVKIPKDINILVINIEVLVDSFLSFWLFLYFRLYIMKFVQIDYTCITNIMKYVQIHYVAYIMILDSEVDKLKKAVEALMLTNSEKVNYNYS